MGRTDRKDQTMMPQNHALILEGGGMRGYFNAGVLDALMEEGMQFPYVIGVSAGAANALSYVSNQYERNKQIIEQWVCDPRYIGKRNLFTYGSIMNMDFIFHQMPQKYLPVDWDAFYGSPIHYLIGAFDLISGQTQWLEKQDVDEQADVLIASCSLPFISKIVRWHGHLLLDGGLVDAIPIQKSIQDGNQFHVICMTQNPGYVKRPTNLRLAKIFYRKYPKLLEALESRHRNYNEQVKLCEQLEREGKAIIIRPQKKVCVGRLERDRQKILDLYFEGRAETQKAIAHYRQLQTK